MKPNPMLLMAGLLFAGCAGTDLSSHKDMLPSYATFMTASGPVTGSFLMRVRRTGKAEGKVFLNSEQNFRATTCLTIVVPDAVASTLSLKMNGDISELLRGKLIRVYGTARKVPVWADERGVTHFQTHLVLDEATQLTVVDQSRPNLESSVSAQPETGHLLNKPAVE